MRTRAADVLVDTLLGHGCTRIFGVPGESYLAVLDALLDKPGIDFVSCRHEGAASFSAVADAAMTGKPGVLFVSRGPGMTNASIGIHVAAQDALPLVVFVGQVERRNLGRGAFQEIDYAVMFGGVAKWVGVVHQAARVAEIVATAFAQASSGTPGPVVVVLPEDVLDETCTAAPVAIRCAPAHGLADEILDRVAMRIAGAARPVLLVGGECRSAEFRADLLACSVAWNVPVAVTNKNQDQFPNTHGHWIGHLGVFVPPPMSAMLKQADLVIAVGTRLGDLTSQGYSFPRQDNEPQALLHVYPDPAVLGRHFATELGIVSGSHAFVQALCARAAHSRHNRSAWLAQAAAVQTKVHGWDPDQMADADVFGHVMTSIAMRLQDDAIVTLDAGNFASWVHRVLRLGTFNTMLGAACGAMGMGVPAAVAACLRYPGRQTIAFCGDGGFMMTGNELATLMGRGLSAKIVVADNRSYGTIRSYQEKHYPDRVYGTDLHNPDFAALARAHGAGGYTVSDARGADAIVAEFLAEPGPAVLHVRYEVEQIMARMTLADLKR